MEDKTIASLTTVRRRGRRATNQPTQIGYGDAEQKLTELLQVQQIDGVTDFDLASISGIDQSINEAIAKAFAPVLSTTYRRTSGSHLAHQFLQRAMYQINRLQRFVANPSSSELVDWRDRIESVWQQWEQLSLDIAAIQKLDVVSALRDRISQETAPPLSENVRLLRTQITEAGYERLVAVLTTEVWLTSHLLADSNLDQRPEGLSPLVPLLLEEYAGDRFNSAQFSLYCEMLAALKMKLEPEIYFELAPWELLALLNQNYLQTRQLDRFLCYIGALLYTEISTPARLEDYRFAAKRLSLPIAAIEYWEHEIAISIRHGHSLLENVILPLVCQYPTEAWKLLWGYDQQKIMSDRACAAIARSVRAAERAAARANR